MAFAAPNFIEVIVLNNYRNYDWLYEKYIIEKRAAPEIGELCGVSHRTILNWLYRFGILVRSAAESLKLASVRRRKSDGLKSYYNEYGAVWTGREHSEETKRKMSESRVRYYEDNEHNWLGRKHSEKTKRRMSETASLLERSEEHKQNLAKAQASLEVRKRKSATIRGISLDEWDGFSSYEPYCDKFNDKLKERVRNRDHRVCRLCGKSEILEGKRLSVHHIDGDKMQGCNEKNWYLVALCSRCHGVKDTPEKEFLIVTNGVY